MDSVQALSSPLVKALLDLNICNRGWKKPDLYVFGVSGAALEHLGNQEQFR